jgi:Zn2+/Cd2+-exporting ATPase
MTTFDYRVHGLHCAAEIQALEETLGRHPGVVRLQFDLVAERMLVELDPHRISPMAVVAHVARLGMRAEPWADGAAGAEHRDRWRVWLALAGGVLLAAGFAALAIEAGGVLAVLAEADHDHAGPLHPVSATLFALAALTGLVTVLPRAWTALRLRRLDMNILVVAAVVGAVLLGAWSEGAMVVWLFSLAGVLEGWSAARARRAVAGVMRLTPAHAHVLEAGGERCVPIEQVAPGALVLVRPGDRVPVDAVIVSGASTLDEGLLSGETNRVARGPGDPVLAGSLNGHGALEVRATRAASDSVAARMTRMLDEARLKQTATERWIERFARRYTPAVLATAAVIAIVPPLAGLGLWSDWIYRGLVTILVACPCALVISTPVTVVAAIASAARTGVLVKGGAFLETLARVRAVVFDKSGLLTEAQPEVAAIEPVAGRSQEVLLARLLAVESRSEHPIARALVGYGRARALPAVVVGEVDALPGRGVVGRIDGRAFWVGSRRLLEERAPGQAGELLVRAAALEAEGHSVVFCGEDAEVWGLVALRDPVRPASPEAVRALRALGVERVMLLTGASPVVAEALGRALGVDETRAGLAAEDKATVLEELVRRHGVVAVVGDGAGAGGTRTMEAAPVAIAVGPRSAPAAVETADIVLADDDLAGVPWIVAHARDALRVVKQNVAFAIGAKVAFVAFAVAGYATLWMAVAADTGATIAVTLNGLRLLRPRVRGPRPRRVPH